MSTNTDSEIVTSIASDPEVRAFINQQVQKLKPYLIQSGTCGVKIDVSKDSPSKKMVSFYYTVDNEVIKAQAEHEDVFQATIQARKNMQEGLNKLINSVDDIAAYTHRKKPTSNSH